MAKTPMPQNSRGGSSQQSPSRSPSTGGKSEGLQSAERDSERSSETTGRESENAPLVEALDIAASREDAIQNMAKEMEGQELGSVGLHTTGTSTLEDAKTLIADGSPDSLDVGRSVERFHNHTAERDLLEKSLHRDSGEYETPVENEALKFLNRMNAAKQQDAPGPEDAKVNLETQKYIENALASILDKGSAAFDKFVGESLSPKGQEEPKSISEPTAPQEMD